MALATRVAGGYVRHPSSSKIVLFPLPDPFARFYDSVNSTDLRLTVNMEELNPQLIPGEYKAAALKRSKEGQCE